MIRTTRLLATIFLVLALGSRLASGADTVNTDVVGNVDQYGDGTITLTFRLSASQWENWRERYGDHPDLLWRDWKQEFAKYALEKFDLKRDDINRTATANIVARALTTVRADGTRAIDMANDARFVSGGGLEWIFESVAQASPLSPIVTTTTRIMLPAGATNAHVETVGSEPQRLVYELPETNADNGVFFWSGVSAIIIGAIFGIIGLLFALVPPRSASPISSPH